MKRKTNARKIAAPKKRKVAKKTQRQVRGGAKPYMINHPELVPDRLAGGVYYIVPGEIIFTQTLPTRVIKIGPRERVYTGRAS